MATEDPPTVPQESHDTTKMPDYLSSPNAIFGDQGVKWRYGRAPDYTKTRKVWAEGKTMNHAPGSLEEMVENLVKNWEVEASFKPRLSDWRTIDHERYSFAMGGGPPQDAEHMIRVGTYNGIIAPNEYYSPENSDFASSHKTFKRMMPTFAWEVLEVYSGPPRVSFRWRHWGVMKNDYVGFNNKGEKVTAKAHGGLIDIEGVTVAGVDDKVRLRDVQTWMDPLEMFRQIAPHGIVNKATMNRKVDKEAALDVDPESAQAPTESLHAPESENVSRPESNVVSESRDEQTGDLGHTGLSTTQTQQTPSRPVTVSTTNPLPLGQTNSQAQSIVTSAVEQGADREVESIPSNAPVETDVIPPDSSTPSSTATTDAPNTTNPSTNTTTTTHRSIYSSPINGRVEDIINHASQTSAAVVVDDDNDASSPEATTTTAAAATTYYDAVDQQFLEGSAEQVHPHPKDMEVRVQPRPGEAVAVGAQTEETRLTHEEMSSFAPGECPFLMNRE